MRRIKIMLAAVTVLAAVGGALAFKASNYNGIKFCIKPIEPGLCRTLVQNVTFVPAAQVNYTRVTDGFTNNLSCTTVECPQTGLSVVQQ